MSPRPLLLVGLVFSFTLTARGIDPPADVPHPAPHPAEDADAFRGPTIAKHPDRPEHSIVERDFNGRLKKLDEVPAMVALSRLDLTAEEKARVDKALGDRAVAIDAIVRDNLRLILEMAGAGQAGQTETQVRARAELFQKAQPFLARGPILGEIKPALPEAKFAELKRMLDEYNAIAIQERLAEPPAGEKPNRFGARLAEGFEGFAQEAKASYRRVFESGGKDFENLLKMLDLTPEQESKIRQKATDVFLKTYGKPTKRQQLQIFLDIYAELDTEQRHRLARYIGEENKVRRSTAEKAKPAPESPMSESPSPMESPMEPKP